MSAITIKEIGRVKEVKKTIARVNGLSNFMNGQLVDFVSLVRHDSVDKNEVSYGGNGIKGLIVGFEKEEVLVLILGEESSVRIGQEVAIRQEEFKIPVGEQFLGRIVNALGEQVDGKGPVVNTVNSGECRVDREKLSTNHYLFYTNQYPVFRDAPETMDRAEADSVFESGTKIIDAVIPLSKGQRQLIIGDRMTGKTTVCVDAILNQKGKNTICIYCCIGKSFSSFLKVVRILKTKQAFDYCVVVSATASSSIGEQYIAPYTAAALGEYFMDRGRDVFVVFDDLTKHAWAYRQISLLLERPPGREAYPGDIYYIHSQLMERAGRLNAQAGGGSMTFFPVVDTLQGDVKGFIPSNLISMTDGQIYLSSSLFSEGFKPAIDFLMSVSIIGVKTQSPILKKLSGAIRIEYAQYKELLRLMKLKAGLTSEVERKIHRGQAITAVLTQDKNRPVTQEELIVLFYALERRILDELDIPKLNQFKNEIYGYISVKNSGLIDKLKHAQDMSADIKKELDELFLEYFKSNQC